jgi:Domain of unknown function (DUF4868)
MTQQIDLQTFKSFPVDESQFSLWVFKKRIVSGDANPFSAVSVMTSSALQVELKSVIKKYQEKFVEVEEYSLLSQPNESGMLRHSAEMTSFPSLKELADRPQEEHYVKKISNLNNAAGYLLRLRHNDDLLYCVRKTTNDWTTKKSRAFLNIVFKEKELDLQNNPAFTISRSFDFFGSNDSLLLCNKASFESLLSHRETYTTAFNELRLEASFAAAFVDLDPIIEFVGHNSIQLRRMAVIRARGHYKDPDYLARLRVINAERSWGIGFDDSGRIVPTAETARTIIQVLLNHRLWSELSHNSYDVPSTVAIG